MTDRQPRIYTRKGDDGTTGLLFGSRVSKSAAPIVANGDIDETQAAIGLARAVVDSSSTLNEMLMAIERQLYTAMAEVATPADARDKLGDNVLGAADVKAMESAIDSFLEKHQMPSEFVIPGANELSARFDVARTVCRRAERSTLAVELAPESMVPAFLNRLSDLLWALARAAEG